MSRRSIRHYAARQRRVALASLVLLGGCGHSQQVQQQQATLNDELQAARTMLPESDAGLVPNARVYLSNGTVTRRQPGVLHRHIGAPGLRVEEKMSVVSFASQLSEHIGYPIDVAGDVYQPRETSGAQQSGATQATAATDSSEALNPLGELTVRYELPRITYQAAPTEQVGDVLSRIINAYGLSWRHDDDAGRLEIYRYETGVFPLPISASLRQSAMALQDGRATTALQSQQDLRQSILTSVESLLSDEGRAHISQGGVLVVSDAASSVAAIGRYLDQELAQHTRQVVISTRLLVFTDSRAEAYGLNWDAAYNGGHQRVSLTSTPSGILGGVGGDVSIVSPASKFLDSAVNLDALSESSGVAVAYRGDMVTLSGMPVSTNEITSTAYLESVTGNVATNSNVVSATLEPGEIKTGLSLWFDPRVYGNDIFLSMAFSLTSLLDLDEEVSGDNRITTPEFAVRDGAPVVKLASGGAMAVSGFYATIAENDAKGVGHPEFVLAGGSRRSVSETRRAVLVVSARIVE